MVSRLPIAALLLVILAAACSSGSSAATSGGASQPSVAEKLHVVEGNATTAEYQHALDKLGPKCRERAGRLGDFAVKTQQIIENKTGQHEPLISILRHVNQSIPKALGKTPCLDIFTAYAILRTR